MDNKQGYMLGVFSGIIYTFVANKDSFEIIGFIAQLIGVLLIPLIISYFIVLFSKSKKFGKVFGITTLIVVSIGLLGNYSYKKEKEIEKKKDIDLVDLIISEQKESLNQLNKKLSIGNKKEILNELTLNSNFIFNLKSDEVFKKLKEADLYFNKMKKGNDSIIEISINKLEKLKLSNKEINTKKAEEIDDYILKMNMLKTNIEIYYLNVSQLIFEMNNLINVKLKCKNEIENNNILFYEQGCLNEYNKIFSNIKKLLTETNNARLNIKNI